MDASWKKMEYVGAGYTFVESLFSALYLEEKNTGQVQNVGVN